MYVPVATEVWIAAALLHTESPRRGDFSVKEIIHRVRDEAVAGGFRRGVQTHVSQHCVANKHPNPNSHRLLYEVARGRRRLFRPGDDFHPFREGGRTAPARDELPQGYRHLLDWYRQVYCRVAEGSREEGDGSAFRDRAAALLTEHLGVELLSDRIIRIGEPPLPHRFDLVSPSGDFVGTCREGQGGQISAASVGSLHVAVLFLSRVPEGAYRFVVLPRPAGAVRPSLAEHYFQNYRHLLGGVQLIEVEDPPGSRPRSF